MSGCCNEQWCTRKKPMMLMRSDLTGTWYIVTAYTEVRDGVFRASTKHRLPDDKQDQLEDLRDGHAAAARADRVLDEFEANGVNCDVVKRLRKALAPSDPTTDTGGEGHG